MKPIMLKIKGINSFEDEQVINFDDLLSYGLFGIFGPTGSGKSSIIDAITISLYGEASRFKGDKKSKIFLNSNVNSGYVVFEFSIMNSNSYKTYKIERSFKRSNEIQKNTKTILLLNVNEKYEPIEEGVIAVNKKINEILGLNYDDFLRCVILPQGKFSEFLSLANKERREMLERIFKLEDYGELLSEKIKKRYNDVKTELYCLEKTKNSIGDVTLEKIEEQKEDLRKIENKINKIDKYYNNIEKSIENNKINKKNLQDLKKYNDERDKLIKSKNEIDKKRKLLKEIEIYNIYKDYEENKNKLLKTEEEYESTEKELKKTEEEYFSIKKELDNFLNNDEKIFNNLKYSTDIISELIKNKNEKDKLEEEFNKLKKQKNTCEIQKDKILNKNKAYKERLDEIERKINEIDSCYKLDDKNNILKANNILSNIKDLKNKKEELEENSKSMQKKQESLKRDQEQKNLNISFYKEEINKLNNKLDELNKNKSYFSEENLREKEKEIEELERIYKEKKEYKDDLDLIPNKEKEKEDKIKYLKYNLKNCIEENNKLKENLKNEYIKILNKELKENEPCPVCGSLHHKNIENHLLKENNNIKELDLLNKQDKLSKKIGELEKKIEKLEDEKKEIITYSGDTPESSRLLSMHEDTPRPSALGSVI